MASQTPEGKAGEDDLQAQLDALKADIAALAALLQGEGRGLAEALAAKAAEMSGEAAQRTREALGDIGAETARIEERIETRVREKPLQSVLLAFGLGLFVSVLLRR